MFDKAKDKAEELVGKGQEEFGDYGDTHVRFALIENQDRIRQAVRGIKAMFRVDGVIPAKG